MLTRNEAEAITNAIKENINQVGQLIRKARDGKAWKVLGFASFSDWLQNAVGISRARGYQLINISIMEDDLRSIAALPEDLAISSRTVQQITTFGSSDFLARWAEVSGQDPVQNEKLLFNLIQEVRVSLQDKYDFSFNSNTAQILNRDPNQYVLIAATSVLTQVEEFPTPEEVDDAHLPVVRGKLRDALTRIEEQIVDYSAGVEQSRAANA